MSVRLLAAAGVVVAAVLGGGSSGASDAALASASASPKPAKIIFVNVAQGDGVVMRVGGKIIVSDAGEHRVENVDEALRSLGAKRIDVAILSHPHDDHVRNFLPLITQLGWRVKLVIVSESAWWQGTATNRTLMKTLDEEDVEIKHVHAGDSFDWGGAEWNVLSPPAGEFTGGSNQAANSSVVYLLRVNGVSALFTGDIERRVADKVARLLDGALDGPVDIFLATHHGSKEGSTKDLLDVVKPRWAVISSGQNPYRHPSLEAIARLEAAGASIWCTDVNGSVTARISAAGGLTWRASLQAAPWWSAKAQAEHGSCVGR